MVIGAFPIAKLGALLIKQISKPIANVCKERAKNNPFFRTYVCMPPAQFYNWCEVKAKMWVLNLGKPVNIPVLSQDMAIELGANLLGETVIFVIGSALLILEYNRQSNKESAKEEKRLAEMEYITSTLTELYFTVQQQQTQLRELERMIHSIPGTPKRKPEGPVSPPIYVPPQPQQPLIPPQPPHPMMPPQLQQPIGTPQPQQPMEPPKSKTDGPVPQNVTYETDSSTPYPNRGFILRSLNYIQLDVLNSLMIANNDNRPQPHDERIEVPITNQHPAVVTATLHNIENEFRSLF